MKTIELNETLLNLEKEFNSILSELNELDDKNFQTKFEGIKNSQNNILTQRENLLQQFDSAELKKYNSKFDNIIKQITKKFDNIVLEKKNKQQKISDKLNILLNRKKLVNYQR